MARTTRKVLDLALGAAKSIKRVGVTSWKYLKVEAVPPLTVNFFNGPAGRKMEYFAGKIANGFIGFIEGRIKEIDDEAERERQELLAAIKAREERLKAEAKRKEAERIKAAALRMAEALKKAAALAEQKQIEIEAKEEKEKPKPKPKDKPKRGGRKGRNKKRKLAKQQKPPTQTK